MYQIQRTPEFDEWMSSLDPAVIRRVASVLSRMSAGNWGDYKPLAGVPGIFERRLTGSGPGIRLYFFRSGSNTVMMLIGGEKADQQRGDIARARRLRDDLV